MISEHEPGVSLEWSCSLKAQLVTLPPSASLLHPGEDMKLPLASTSDGRQGGAAAGGGRGIGQCPRCSLTPLARIRVTGRGVTWRRPEGLMRGGIWSGSVFFAGTSRGSLPKAHTLSIPPAGSRGRGRGYRGRGSRGGSRGRGMGRGSRGRGRGSGGDHPEDEEDFYEDEMEVGLGAPPGRRHGTLIREHAVGVRGTVTGPSCRF